MKKILVVQSRTQPERITRERTNFTRAIEKHAEVEFLSALDEKLAWTTPDVFLKEFGGVIFGGSSDFDFHGGRDEKDPARVASMIILSRVKNIISYALTQHISILGVCFGHQIIAQMHGGKVENDTSQGKFGAHEVRLTEEGKRDYFFQVLPESFYAQYAHKDSVTNLPVGATLLATGSMCRFSALRYGKRAYTVQFHPEVERWAPEDPESPDASRIVPLWIERCVLETEPSNTPFA